MITIYSKDNCSYCDKAKALLEKKGLLYREFKIGSDITLDTFTATFPSVKTVPYILEDGTPIGGFNELTEHLRNNSSGAQFLTE